MQISIRSQLIAGTAAVMGASAIAMTPVTAAHLDLSTIKVPAIAQVALAGFDSPISELLGTSVMATNYLFNSGSIAGIGTWPFAGFTGVLPAALALPELGGYTSVGLIPQIIDDALPIISQLGYNGTDYLQATTTSLYAAANSISEGVWNAAGEALQLDIAGAISTLVGSVAQAGSYLLTAGGYVLTGVTTRAAAVLEAVIDLVPTLIGATLGQVQVLGDAVGDVFNNLFTALGSGNIEGAWNAVVNGLLGPSGIPGTVLNLTLGAGVQTGPIPGPGAIADNFVPSIRTEVQAGVKAIAGALATPVAGPAASVSSARAAAAAPAVESAPAVAAVTASDVKDAVAETPAAEAVTSEAPAADNAPAATGDDSAPAEKSVSKHRQSRNAAKAANAG